MDIALCMLDTQNKGQLHFSGANNPIWIKRAEEIVEIRGVSNRWAIMKTNILLQTIQ